MRKIVLIIAVIAIVAIIISLLGAAVMTNNSALSLPSMEAQHTDTGTSTLPSPASDALAVPESSVTNPSDEPAGTAVKEFTITGKNYSFAPAAISVKKGDRVRITLKNTGGAHNLAIDEFGIRTEKIDAGEEVIVEFVADRMGSFEYYCSIGSHRQMGMKGTLTVTE